MCGIVGIVGRGDVAAPIVDGLSRLEYRGYDSAGIATIDAGRLSRRRAVGKLSALRAVLEEEPLSGAIGIGHTRWATHGAPTVANAHPHAGDGVAVVHNGIIENYASLREELSEQGVTFESETDTETVAKLIAAKLAAGTSPRAAFAETLKSFEGAFALAVLFEGDDRTLYCARRGSPLAIGRTDGAAFIGSDAYALAPFTNRVTYLAEGDWAVVTTDCIEIFDEAGAPVHREEQRSDASAALVDKAGHRHFMAKEIHEQPEVIAHTLAAYIDSATQTLRLPSTGIDFSSIPLLTLSACGTASYAALAAKYWMESLAGLRVEHDIASELRYRDFPYPEGSAALFISQSGETADTLAALRDAQGAGQRIGVIVNVAESTIAREADALFPIHAGPEIGVASTKAFTCQLASLAAITIGAATMRGRLREEDAQTLVTGLMEAPRKVADALRLEERLGPIVHDLAQAEDVMYLGRGPMFPIAKEGALKLTEISYIHAEGYPAGELKHGPIALIDDRVPVVVLAPPGPLFEKTISNMQEVMARGGKCLLISSPAGLAEARKGGAPWAEIPMPECHPLIAPIVYAVPMQLLAYHVAVAKGTDVDQPRNLAKSVTVE